MGNRITLNQGERIIAAWAERCSGPGWSNQIINVVIRDGNQKLRWDAIQPENMTRDMLTLFDISEAAQRSMVAAINAGKVNRKLRGSDVE